MTGLPPLPTDSTDVRAWVESLNAQDLSALTQLVVSGELSRRAAEMLDAKAPNRGAIEVPPPPSEPSLLTLTIELRGSKPRIWRRLALPGDLTLDVVHVLFQAAMGWADCHLHHFEPGVSRRTGQWYFLTEFDEDEGDEGTREAEVRLDQVLRAPGDHLIYRYDFGDDWVHRVKLESVTPLSPEDRQPRCLRGAKACPPENVGGIWGHQELAAWLRAGAPRDSVPEPFDDADEAHAWLPIGYDPDEFDAAEATAAMREWMPAV